MENRWGVDFTFMKTFLPIMTIVIAMKAGTLSARLKVCHDTYSEFFNEE